MRKGLAVAVCTVVGLLGAVGAASAATTQYSGTLTWSNNQIIANDGWTNSGTTMSWVVSTEDEIMWKYKYTFTVTAKSISHMILETTDPISRDSITVLQGNMSNDSPNDWTPSNGNPGMPSPFSLYGLKFNAPTDSTGDVRTIVAEFTVNRAPVWGDFYAKDGGGQDNAVVAYNAGFNGTLLNGAVDRDGICTDVFLAVPDGAPVVPEASTVALGAMGLLSSAGYVIRRRK